MKGLISEKRAEKIINKYDEWISSVAERYKMPSAAIKAILYKEMTMTDLMDVAV